MTLVHATCSELPGGTVPDTVQLLPPGSFKARDGRAFRIDDPQALIARFTADAVDKPVDYEHQEDDPARRGNGPVPAAGWIKSIFYDARSGFWAKVDWTARARDLIANREYRYLSPVFTHDANGRIKRLMGASLVHRPALHIKALASEQEHPMPDNPNPFARIAKALDLPEDATEDAIIAALGERLATASEVAPDPAKFVPIEAVRELMAERVTSKATNSETQARARVQDAMREGHITPAMQDWAVALCRQDPESFESFVQSSAAPFGHLFKGPSANRAIPAHGATAGSVEEQAICAQLGIDPGELAKG